MIQIFLCLLLFLFSAHSHSFPEGELREPCRSALIAAFKKKKFPQSSLKNCPLTQKLIAWHKYQQGKSGASFEEMTAFISQNSEWPRLKLLQQRAEETLSDEISNEILLAWFGKMNPVTFRGTVRYIEGLQKKGFQDKATALVKKVWNTQSLMGVQQRDFYKIFQAYLTPKDMTARLTYLGYQSNKTELRALFVLLSPKDKLLAETLIVAMGNTPEFMGLVKKLDASQLAQPVLLFHLVQTLLGKDKIEKAAHFYDKAARHPDFQQYAEKWMGIKKRLMRFYLRNKKPLKAYEVIRTKGLKLGPDLVEAEFRAGWIALRFLDRPDVAAPHLYAFYKAAGTPIYRAKAAYWMGYLYEKQGQIETSQQWYEESASYPLTFFGQMAHESLQRPLNLILKGQKHAPHLPPKQCSLAFKEMMYALRLLRSAGISGYEKVILVHLAETRTAECEREHIVHAAKAYIPGDLIVITKLAAKKGLLALEAAYPTLPPRLFPEKGILMAVTAPLINAVIRQESGFNTNGKSPSGALGLMQLMPKTAQELASGIKVKIKKSDHLLTMPHLNVKLGSLFLTKLLQAYEGNLILTLASYNAGKGRVGKWIKDYGDPRTGEIDMLDWVEIIPAEETRTYVYRILESLPIYEKTLVGGNQ